MKHIDVRYLYGSDFGGLPSDEGTARTHILTEALTCIDYTSIQSQAAGGGGVLDESTLLMTSFLGPVNLCYVTQKGFLARHQRLWAMTADLG